MRGTGGPQFPPLAFLWPALAAETASEFASAMAREFINLAVGPGTETGAPEPQFTTRNKVVLELATGRLWDACSDRPRLGERRKASFAAHGEAIVAWRRGSVTCEASGAIVLRPVAMPFD